MILCSQSLKDIRYIRPNSESLYLSENAQWLAQSKFIQACIPVRNTAIEWMYRAQAITQFDQVTLLMAISLLDKLLLQGFSLNKHNLELVSATLTLICTKFNEIYPISIRRLNSLLRADKNH